MMHIRLLDMQIFTNIHLIFLWPFNIYASVIHTHTSPLSLPRECCFFWVRYRLFCLQTIFFLNFESTVSLSDFIAHFWPNVVSKVRVFIAFCIATNACTAQERAFGECGKCFGHLRAPSRSLCLGFVGVPAGHHSPWAFSALFFFPSISDPIMFTLT